MKSTYMCFLKDFKENRPRLALILRLTAIVGIDMIMSIMSNVHLKELKYNQAKVSNRASLRASEYVSGDGKAIFNALFA
jgi:hypothetical protein